MSRLRAKCPSCRTQTAVALGPDYECHACGREFAAGLVRVPRAWGDGGEAMAEAAWLDLPYPEAAVVDEDALGDQSLMLATNLPDRPVVLGGCCCAHVGAVEALAARHGRIGVLWLDAHGDLNTPATSPSGNAWGMPLRMLLESGAVDAPDVALVGARALDPGEEAFLASSAVHTGPGAVGRALEEVAGVYVAFDADSVEPRELASFMPEPNGHTLAEVERDVADATSRAPLLGVGLTGLVNDPRNLEPLARVCAAAGL